MSEAKDNGGVDVSPTEAAIEARARVIKQRMTPREFMFASRWFETGDILSAYKSAFPVAAMSDKEIQRRANQLGNQENIKYHIEKMWQEAADIAVIDKAAILQEMAAVALGDPMDALRIRTYCCRHCHGFDFRYQWVDAQEFQRACALYDAAEARAKSQGLTMDIPRPTDEGGYEFKKTLPPAPDCPVCDGAGSDQQLIIKPDNKWKATTRRLVSGVKQGKNGIEITWRNQTEMLKLLAEASGLLRRPLVDVPPADQPQNGAAPTQDVSQLSDAELGQLKDLLSRAVASRDNSAAIDVLSRPVTKPNALPLDLSSDVPNRRPKSDPGGSGGRGN